MFTPRTAARSRAGGSRSPGFASPSAIARRISAATCSKSSVGSCLSILTFSIVPVTIAPDDRATKTPGARRARGADQGGPRAAAASEVARGGGRRDRCRDQSRPLRPHCGRHLRLHFRQLVESVNGRAILPVDATRGTNELRARGGTADPRRRRNDLQHESLEVLVAPPGPGRAAELREPTSADQAIRQLGAERSTQRPLARERRVRQGQRHLGTRLCRSSQLSTSAEFARQQERRSRLCRYEHEQPSVRASHGKAGCADSVSCKAFPDQAATVVRLAASDARLDAP